jgi:hypothetical protein
MAGRLAPASEIAGGHTIQFLKGHGLPSRRRTYLTILKLADHALFKIVWYVLLRLLRPELDGRPSSANFSYSCTKLATPIYLLH